MPRPTVTISIRFPKSASYASRFSVCYFWSVKATCTINIRCNVIGSWDSKNVFTLWNCQISCSNMIKAHLLYTRQFNNLLHWNQDSGQKMAASKLLEWVKNEQAYSYQVQLPLMIYNTIIPLLLNLHFCKIHDCVFLCLLRKPPNGSSQFRKQPSRSYHFSRSYRFRKSQNWPFHFRNPPNRSSQKLFVSLHFYSPLHSPLLCLATWSHCTDIQLEGMSSRSS